MEIDFWNLFRAIVGVTSVLLAFFISYYLLLVKKRFASKFNLAFGYIAQGFLLLLCVSIVIVLGGLVGILPLGRMNALSMLLLPSLIWSLLLLYQGSRGLVKAVERKKKA